MAKRRYTVDGMEEDPPQTTARFEPSRGSHAIQEAVFFVQFVPELDGIALQGLFSQLAELGETFPENQEEKKLTFSIHPDGTTGFMQGPGARVYSRFGPDGGQDWSLRIAGDSLSVHSLNYTRWNEIWPLARDFLMGVLAKIPGGTAIAGLGLKYVDRFRYSGSINNYDASILLKRDNRYISPRCFEVDDRWHSNTGWFARVSGVSDITTLAPECLNQLNVMSGREVSPTETVVAVTIDHSLLLRPTALGAFSIDGDGRTKLDAIMQALHLDNKRTMSHLLTPAMCKRLNLVVEETE